MNNLGGKSHVYKNWNIQRFSTFGAYDAVTEGSVFRGLTAHTFEIVLFETNMSPKYIRQAPATLSVKV